MKQITEIKIFAIAFVVSLLEFHEYCKFKLATEFLASFTPTSVENYLSQFRMIYRIRKYTKKLYKITKFCKPTCIRS